MRRSSTLTRNAYWSDPFRLVLAISLLALGGWIVLQSGTPDASSSRIRPGDVDPVDAAPIVVSFDDVSPFGMPVEADPDAGGTGAVTPRPAPARGTSPTRSRGSSSTRGPTRTTGTTRQPPKGGGTTTPTPSTTSPAPSGPGNGPAPQSPVVTAGNSGTSGGPGVPAAPVQPSDPGVQVPVPVPALPGTSNGSGNGTVKDLVTQLA